MRRLATLLTLLLVLGSSARADDVAALLERGHLRKAESALVRRLEAAPADGAALEKLSRLRTDQGRYDEAVTLAERAIAAEPRSAAARYALAAAYGVKARNSGALRAAGAARRYKKEAEATLALDPSHPRALEGLIEFHSRAPGLVGGDKQRIPGLLDRLTAAAPATGWMVRARLAAQANDTLAAAAHFRRAAASGDGAARLALANWLAPPWREPAAALRIARELVATEPWRQGAWALIATLEAQQGDLDALDRTLAAAEAADPEHLGATYSAARTLVTTRRDPVRAERMLRRYLAVPAEIGWPSHAGARWRLAQALEQQGRVSEAVAELRVAVNEQPDLDGAKKDLQRLGR